MAMTNYYRRPPVLDDPYFTRGDYRYAPSMGAPMVGPREAPAGDQAGAYAVPSGMEPRQPQTNVAPKTGLRGLLGTGDLNDPKTLGLLGVAASLLESSGPSSTPIGLGQAIGRAGMAGIGGYQQGRAGIAAQQAQDDERELKNSELALRREQLNLMRARPSVDARPEIIQTLEGAGVPRDRWADIVSQKYTRPQTQVNLNTTGEAESAKEIGKGFGEQYNAILKGAEAATRKLDRADRLTNLLDGLETGKLTPLALGAAGYGRSLGFKIDPKWSNIEAAQALTAEMALELRNPSGGAGMPGALSDKDREFLTSMVPGVDKTPQGRKLIVETTRKLAKREREVAAMARAYRQQRGGVFDEGFYDVLADYSAKNPLFASAQEASAGVGGSSDPLGIR